ncbi:MAG: hypothetical protein LAN71_07660 [Acidobacteriia bacterium]|nr:hypothetical protein [Terriglobia bacterium]
MASDEGRLLDPAHIPETLWASAPKVLFIPHILARAYETVIDRYALKPLSQQRTSDNPPVGGLNQERTDQHFAQAFDGSVARVELAILDPRQVSTSTSNAMIKSMAGNTVCLTDAPCGAGAAAFALLSTIAELRATGILPRLPLEVFLIGAEPSVPARSYAISMLGELRASLEEQAIFVREEFMHWDVLDPVSNTNLIRRATILSANSSHNLLVIANFNGFLERDGKRKEAQPQIAELFRHASAAGDYSVAIWIEPDMNRATADGALFQWLKDKIKAPWKRFTKQNPILGFGEPISTCSAEYRLPLDPSQTARVKLAVMRIDLIQS